jgi:hypothetical protein
VKKKIILLTSLLSLLGTLVGFAQSSTTDGAKSITPTADNSTVNTDIHTSATYGAKSISPVSQPNSSVQTVSTTGVLQTENSSAVSNKKETVTPTVTAKQVHTVEVYKEGKLKGQPIPKSTARPVVADPKKQAAEKQMIAERNKKQHPVTTISAEQKLNYNAKREAELKSKKK